MPKLKITEQHFDFTHCNSYRIRGNGTETASETINHEDFQFIYKKVKKPLSILNKISIFLTWAFLTLMLFIFVHMFFCGMYEVNDFSHDVVSGNMAD